MVKSAKIILVDPKFEIIINKLIRSLPLIFFLNFCIFLFINLRIPLCIALFPEVCQELFSSGVDLIFRGDRKPKREQ